MALSPIIFRGSALTGVLAALLLGGCGPKTDPKLPGGPAPSPPAPATAGDAAGPEIRNLPVDRNAEFDVRVGHRALAIVEHYDAALARSGWEKIPPRKGQPGERTWISTGAQVGPTDAYEATWSHPPTGRSARLTLFHMAESPEVQHGTFEIYEKGQEPG